LTTLRSDADVFVVGSTLSGLVTATYLARAGLRVVMLEESTHRKRPPLLREPFLLPGLGEEGPIRDVLRELAMPLIDQREIRREDVSVQVILPGARVDVFPDTRALAVELQAYGLADADAAQVWLDTVSLTSEQARQLLWEEAGPVRAGSAGATEGALGSAVGRLSRAIGSKMIAPPRVQFALPAPPAGTQPFIAALLSALSGLELSESAPAPGLLLDGARDAAWRMPHSGAPFLDLFRRRFASLHGEIWSVDDFEFVSEGSRIGVDVASSRCFASALVLAVPRAPLQRFLDKRGGAPRWLTRGLPVLETPARLFRAERSSLPVGLRTRVVVADQNPSQIRWLAFHPDPKHDGVEWLVAAGPGAASLEAEDALGDLAPFSSEGVVAVDPGPPPLWDIDSSELRFHGAEPAPTIRHRALVASVGGEAGPGLGPEGEILQARMVAIRLANRLAG